MGAAAMSFDSPLYRADIRELVVTGLNAAGEELAIEFWTEAGGLQTVNRK
jgi:hypothetical protein